MLIVSATVTSPLANGEATVPASLGPCGATTGDIGIAGWGVFASVEVLCLLPSGVPAGGGPGSMPVLPAAVLLLTAGLLVVRLRPATTC